jgi:hypothetical protein
MKHATEMRSDAMIYISSFTKIGSDFQKLTRGGDSISLLFSFLNEESRLMTRSF